jgi:DNA-binding PadR family transcriptional regulator
MESQEAMRGPQWAAGGCRGGRGHQGPFGVGRRGRGMGHGGGPAGFGMRDRQTGPRVARGDVRGAALLLLADRPMHGYQMIQDISDRSGGIWQPSAGSVYPALQQLEDEGLVRAEEAEGRRVYHLTEAGRTHVTGRRDELAAAFDAVTGGVDDVVVSLRALFQQVGTALGQVAQAGTSAQIAAAHELMVTTRRQLYRLLADESTETS